MDAFSLLASVVTFAAFGIALWQVSDARKQAAIRRLQLQEQQRRNASTIRAALIGAQTADLIVQRAKGQDATIGELQSLARITRQTLLSLAAELEGEAKVLRSWESVRFLQKKQSMVNPSAGPERTSAVEP